MYCSNAEGDSTRLDINLICSQRKNSILSAKPPALLARHVLFPLLVKLSTRVTKECKLFYSEKDLLQNSGVQHPRQTVADAARLFIVAEPCFFRQLSEAGLLCPVDVRVGVQRDNLLEAEAGCYDRFIIVALAALLAFSSAEDEKKSSKQGEEKTDSAPAEDKKQEKRGLTSFGYGGYHGGFGDGDFDGGYGGGLDGRMGFGGGLEGGYGGGYSHEHVKEIDRPYPVHVPVEKPVPYPIEKPVPYPVKVPINVPYPVEFKVPVHGPEHHDIHNDGGYGASGFAGGYGEVDMERAATEVEVLIITTEQVTD